ncbi:MAG: hypothetical protein JXB46_04035 [Candidatus Eisenbacteria bacterium]|nr:hypothetical protein [Candidatus Eisenbacteria bacterium]
MHNPCRVLVLGAAFVLLTLANALGQVEQVDASSQLRPVESLLYRASFEGIEPDSQGRMLVALETLHKATGDIRFLRLSSRAVKITNLFFVGDSRLVLQGELGSGGDVATLVDLDSGAIADTIWAWQFSMNPQANMAVYRFRYPPRSIQTYDSHVVLAYDFNKSPLENSASSDSFNADGSYNPENRGFILYPETNRREAKYFIPAREPGEQRLIRSPIAWCDSEPKLAFLELFGGRMSIVGIDLAGGLDAPIIRVSELDTNSFYTPGYVGNDPERWRKRGFVASSLSFLPGCQNLEVTTSGGEVFRAGQATVNLDGSTAIH